MSKPSDLVEGTLDMLLLEILALEPMNGFAVSQRLKQVSGDVLQVSDPALHKLEQEGWITAEWKTSEYGRLAKYYSLTPLGRRQLEKKQITGAGFRPRFRGLSSLKRRERRAARNGDWRCDRSIGCTRFPCECGRYFAGRRRTRKWTTSCATTSNEKPRNTSQKE